jgi:ABC-type multidrug transport system fused ATPase/permease subunit
MGSDRTSDTTASGRELYQYYWSFLRPYTGKLVLAAFFLVGAILLHLARPWPLKLIFDYVLVPAGNGGSVFSFLESLDRFDILVGCCAAVALIAAAFALFEYVHTTTAGKVGQKIIFQIREHLYTHVQRLSLGFHGRNKSGDLLSRLLRDINQMRDFLTEAAVSLVAETVLVIGMATIMLLLDWQLTLAGLALLPLMFFAIAHYSNQVRGLSRRRLQKEGAVASMFTERLVGVHEVQLFSAESSEDSRFQEENRKSYKAEMRTLRSKMKLLRVVEVVTAVATCFVLYWGARKVLANALTVGDLLVFVTYLRSLYKPLRRIASTSIQASKAYVAAERVAEILRTEPTIKDHPGAIAAPRFEGVVEFCNVSFSYDGKRPVLENITFRAAPGRTVAVLGPSGAGKSTLVALIPRLYDPAGGAVRIDGEDIRHFTVSTLRKQIAVVSQDPVIFGSTVHANIAFGSQCDRASVERAAQLAQADEFIRKLPKGYNTELGERGASLSGGQRQRIAIARALIRNAPIVVLDEPMTGLDIESESLVLQALYSLFQSRTVFVIAHRLSTVWKADLAIMLENGVLVEAGAPRDLLQAAGAFQRFARLEFGEEFRSAAGFLQSRAGHDQYEHRGR